MQTLKRLSSLHFYAKPWTMASYINANNSGDTSTLAAYAHATAASGDGVLHNEADDLHDTQDGESW